MRVLRPRLCFENAGLTGVVFFTVAACYEALRSGGRVVRKAQRVRSHVGDKTNCSLAGYVHALVKLLGNRHRAARGHAQAARRLLLKRGGNERRRGRALLFSALNGLDVKLVLGDGANHLFDFLLAVKLKLFLLSAVKTGNEAALLLGSVECNIQKPVFLGRERLDLVFALNYHARCNRLHATCGQTSAHLAPEQGAELIANNAVKDAARLLRVYQVHVDIARGGNAVVDHLFCYFVKGDALGFFIGQLKHFL